MLTVNVTYKPPHLGAGSAYLEYITAAEFREEGGHKALLVAPETVKQRSELRLIKLGIAPWVCRKGTQWN